MAHFWLGKEERLEDTLCDFIGRGPPRTHNKDRRQTSLRIHGKQAGDCHCHGFMADGLCDTNMSGQEGLWCKWHVWCRDVLPPQKPKSKIQKRRLGNCCVSPGVGREGLSPPRATAIAVITTTCKKGVAPRSNCHTFHTLIQMLVAYGDRALSSKLKKSQEIHFEFPAILSHVCIHIELEIVNQEYYVERTCIRLWHMIDSWESADLDSERWHFYQWGIAIGQEMITCHIQRPS